MNASPERNLRLSVATGLLVVMAALLCLPARAQEQPTLRGVALVVGQSEYEHLPSLANPAGDADAIEELFDDLGFETTLVSDRDARRLSRDLQRFLEDAEDADVALVYYAGHGIEAGGENFLVPVDADLTALEAAGEMLVPVSNFIRKLQETVPVTIVMLDACRDNPFPPGALVRLNAASDPLAMGAGGLGETRGATRLAPPGEKQAEHYGTVIGFAAAPGMVALDGAPGENSPYAAALLRHLDAMAGEEFALVMRMVGEEVYLRTAGRQRPWVNDSLRRQLFFGAAPTPLAGEEGEILAERRQLLVTIAALPDMERRSVERAAAAGGVPMDALYAMLRTLDQDIPQDAAELEKVLNAQAERLKGMLAERSLLESADPEILRLSRLAVEAVRQGALETAIRLNGQAKRRIGEIENSVAAAEANVRERRIEFAKVYARSASTYALNLNYVAAVEDYQTAYEHALRWDDDLAFRILLAQAASMLSEGERAETAWLERAAETFEKALQLSPFTSHPSQWIDAMHGKANALATLGDRSAGIERLSEATDVLEEMLQTDLRERDPQMWAGTLNNLGLIFQELGTRAGDAGAIERAISLYEQSFAVFTREQHPYDWAMVQVNLGTSYLQLAEWTGSEDLFGKAADGYRAAASVPSDDLVPARANLGSTLAQWGAATGDAARIKEGIAHLEAVLREIDRVQERNRWSIVRSTIGSSYLALAGIEPLANHFEAAIAAQRDVLKERTADHSVMDQAITQYNLANSLYAAGLFSTGTAHLSEAAALYRNTLDVFDAETALNYRVRALESLLSTHADLYALDERLENLVSLIDAYGRLREHHRDNSASSLPTFAQASNEMGYYMTLAGKRTRDVSWAVRAVPVLEEAIRSYGGSSEYAQLAHAYNNLCDALIDVAAATREPATAAEAVVACEEAVNLLVKHFPAADPSAGHLARARALLAILGK